MTVWLRVAIHIMLLLPFSVAEGQSTVPQPSTLLDAAEQLYSDFTQHIRSYKLEGQKKVRLRLRDQAIDANGQWQPWQQTAQWRVWRDKELFIWDCTRSDGQRTVYSFDGKRYYCYTGWSSSGVIQNAQSLRQTDLPPCQNNFYDIYPFDVAHLLQSPLAGGSWLTEEPFYSTLRRSFLSSLEVVRASPSSLTYTLRIKPSGRRVKTSEHLPGEIVFQLDRDRFLPVKMLLRIGEQEEMEYRVVSSQWFGTCWVPTEVSIIARRTTPSGKKADIAETRISLRVYDVNQNIPPQAFRFEFPAGTRLTDETGGESIVGVRWLRIFIGISVVVLIMLLAGILLRRWLGLGRKQ